MSLTEAEVKAWARRQAEDQAAADKAAAAARAHAEAERQAAEAAERDRVQRRTDAIAGHCADIERIAGTVAETAIALNIALEQLSALSERIQREQATGAAYVLEQPNYAAQGMLVRAAGLIAGALPLNIPLPNARVRHVSYLAPDFARQEVEHFMNRVRPDGSAR